MNAARPLIVVVGATGSGKTALAVALCRRLDGELISADSRQLYKGFNAGTAKPTREELRGTPCHLADFLDPRESYDAGRFGRDARRVAGEIAGRGRRVVVAGGTGLYVRALLEGLAPLPAPSRALRARLQEEARSEGLPALHERLSRLDPEAARRVPASNPQRLVRALEVCMTSGRPISELWKEGAQAPLPATILRLDWPSAALRERLARRCRAMWPAMLAEVRALLRSGLEGTESAFESLGYREALAVVEGRLEDAAGLESFARATAAYAKRQRTWFRGQTPGAIPIAGGDPERMLRDALESLS